MKRLHVCCIIMALLVSDAFGYGLSFYIFDAKSNREIPEATIGIKGNGLNLSVAYTAGNSDAFDFAGGTYTFTFSASGYKDSSVTATINGSRSFSIGLKTLSSIRFRNILPMETPFDVHYNEQSSILYVSVGTSGYGMTAISLYSLDGRKIFTTNRISDVTGFTTMTIPIPPLPHGVYYIIAGGAAKSAIKALRIE